MPEKKDINKPEVSFLPPLKMLLSFFDTEARQRKAEKARDDDKKSKEKTVEKLIEKLSEKDE
jgi:hypothetical protein